MKQIQVFVIYVRICNQNFQLRWEYDAIGTLPEYMRESYKVLLDTTNGIAQMVEQKHGSNPIDFLKATVRVTNHIQILYIIIFLTYKKCINY